MKRSLAGLAVGLLVCLSGCGRAADPPAEAEPTPSVSTTTTSPPKTLSPEETVRAWVRAYNRLARTGDSFAVSQLSYSPCSTCDDLTSPVSAAIAAGGAFRNGAWEVKRTRVGRSNAKKTVVDSYVVMHAGAVSSRRGAPFRSFPAEEHILEFTLRKEAGTWLLELIVWL